MSDIKVVDLKFDPKLMDELPAEKQPYGILSWVSKVITFVKSQPKLEEATQTLIVTELNGLLAYIEKSKQIPALISKPLRTEITQAYKEVYSGESRRLLFETVSQLVKYVGASKAEKYSDFKQYVQLLILLL